MKFLAQSFQKLTLSPPIPLRLYTLPYLSNPPFLIFDIRALWHSALSARVPECQTLKMVGQISMALNHSNTSNLEQRALKGLIAQPEQTDTHTQAQPNLSLQHLHPVITITDFSK